jgi:hypothetical protein
MMRFHANACAVAGIPAVVDPGRRALLVGRERELGIQFPAAVAEWYAIPGAVERVAKHSNHHIVPLEQLGLVADGRDLAVGRLLLAVENQGCCDWVVPLPPPGLAEHDIPLPGIASIAEHQALWARAADPPVHLTENGHAADTWALAAPQFSTYAHAGAWDSASFPQPHTIGVYDAPFRDADLVMLQERFVAGPRTYGWADCFGGPGLTVYRFKRPGQQVWVAAHPEETEWWLSADSAASLAAMIDLFARADQPNQALVRELREGLVRTGSDWVQGPAAPGKAAAGPAIQR